MEITLNYTNIIYEALKTRKKIILFTSAECICAAKHFWCYGTLHSTHAKFVTIACCPEAEEREHSLCTFLLAFNLSRVGWPMGHSTDGDSCGTLIVCPQWGHPPGPPEKPDGWASVYGLNHDPGLSQWYKHCNTIHSRNKRTNSATTCGTCGLTCSRHLIQNVDSFHVCLIVIQHLWYDNVLLGTMFSFPWHLSLVCQAVKVWEDHHCSSVHPSAEGELVLLGTAVLSSLELEHLGQKADGKAFPISTYSATGVQPTTVEVSQEVHWCIIIIHVNVCTRE